MWHISLTKQHISITVICSLYDNIDKQTQTLNCCIYFSMHHHQTLCGHLWNIFILHFTSCSFINCFKHKLALISAWPDPICDWLRHDTLMQYRLYYQSMCKCITVWNNTLINTTKQSKIAERYCFTILRFWGPCSSSCFWGFEVFTILRNCSEYYIISIIMFSNFSIGTARAT